MQMVPRRVFFTKGFGVHRDKLGSFEQALRKAGIERFNLVRVSSILPEGCEVVPKRKGLDMLEDGQIVFVVMARTSSNKPNQRISAAIGIAKPTQDHGYGYLSEYSAEGVSAKEAGDYAEDLAATMLATTLGIDFEPETAWDERKRIYRASGKIIETKNICQSGQVRRDGSWATVMAAAVFLV